MKERQGFIRQSYGGFIRQTYGGLVRQPCGGFTLIELLVVISVVVLLMAILLPSLQRARNQGRAVKCQANLRHWGLVFSTYTTDNDGWFMRRVPGRYDDFWYDVLDARQYKDLCFCPMAVKVNPDTDGDGYVRGGKSTAWQYPDRRSSGDRPERGSFGLSIWVYDERDSIPEESSDWYWNTPFVERSARVPVFVDCISPYTYPFSGEPPPPYDYDETPVGSWSMHHFVINRHNGGINILFMDWSARKAGLKELWTLKWHREFDTTNFWTIAGGAKPTDWPEWMRKFKDY